MKLITIVGARPQFVKMAAFARALAGLGGGVSQRVVHTGQHYDRNMSGVFFRQMGLPAPDRNLGIHGAVGGAAGPAAVTGRMMEALEVDLAAWRPDAVLVFGDTDSTLAGALAAARMGLPVAHVEAGMRSFNRAMPEELNRVLADHASDLLLCSTQTAVDNLAAEGGGARGGASCGVARRCSHSVPAVKWVVYSVTLSGS